MSDERPWFYVYRCLMCGEEYEATYGWDSKPRPVLPNPKHAMTNLPNREKFLQLALQGETEFHGFYTAHRMTIHKCSDRKMGTAVLIGIRRERTDLEKIVDVEDE